MTEPDPTLRATPLPEDQSPDRALRPQELTEFIGQEEARANLRVFIESARRWRKMLGGGMRQAGILAAAGLHALAHHVDRLIEDHLKAARVATALKALPTFKLAEEPQTNMVMLSPETKTASLEAHLKSRGILASGTRWVFHLDVSNEQVDQIIEACRSFQPDFRN